MDHGLPRPFENDCDWLLRYCRLPLHVGRGRVERHGNPDSPNAQVWRKFGQLMRGSQSPPPESGFAAAFFLPVDSNLRIFLSWPNDDRLGKSFGENLTVKGNTADGEFELACPEYYVKLASDTREQPGWAVAESVNKPAIISYGEARSVSSVTAMMNNFDFENGNCTDSSDSEAPQVLRVEAAGTTVDFAWRPERGELRRLVDAGLLANSSFVTFSFAAWSGASIDELSQFAYRISSFCQYVVRQHTAIPLLSFFDGEGRVVSRSSNTVLRSKFRDDCALPVMHLDDGLPQLFRESFDEHCRMQQSQLWRLMPSHIASVEDPPYLEQKYASLMAAVELLIRSSLIENGHMNAAEAESKTLPELVGMARGVMRWTVPKHYTAADRYRETRNAVDHGAELPHDSRLVRADFDKWKLFLLRRLFMRLGFTGRLTSPKDGWKSFSAVEEFSEEHNSFSFPTGSK